MKFSLKELIKKQYDIDDKTIESLAMQGRIYVNNEKVFLATTRYDESVNIKVQYQKEKYVSRGAYKLKEAIEKFQISPKDLVCLDIGSSTGGFVQILLENEAKKVYALDSGTNQLDYSLRTNKKVVVYEKTNLKNITSNLFSEDIELVTCDVSFISLKHVFEVCNKTFNNNTKLIVLIKPQFEASKKYVEPGGYVDEKYHPYLKNKIIEIAKLNNFVLQKEIIRSPILGDKSKNIEYLAYFKKEKK
ncbi:TlyA family RNA methyltransferase [Metamycoplasma auris]|uniref:23S rRNA (Cytidine1920-2'-O)/16S rRNA (Cytidine1409-2'-O)-methyltransferase n=1 Tax=Metamycoplasma auris TaxID=51363 RepID=A0A2W7G8M9_9BACT|nr:TlyA family RNA methyltransferase [Metamycoplasma auris]PZV99937.1 23S rRNA (cytidine1920-2'-O)/16S rRNA (cytidine1409-2'-O)-methyltransferase [Metamycoplasma auris]